MYLPCKAAASMLHKQLKDIGQTALSNRNAYPRLAKAGVVEEEAMVAVAKGLAVQAVRLVSPAAAAAASQATAPPM